MYIYGLIQQGFCDIKNYFKKNNNHIADSTKASARIWVAQQRVCVKNNSKSKSGLLAKYSFWDLIGSYLSPQVPSVSVGVAEFEFLPGRQE